MKLGLAFDDILLLPAKSDVLPREVELRTTLADRIELNLPIISAAMDTVTESEMAIALAQEGGMGIIHRNMSIERQVSEIARVKRSESWIILDPITLPPEEKIGSALEVMKRFGISGVPVTEGKRLLGILTNRDLRFEKDMEKAISELMTKENLITAPMGITLEEAKRILHRNRIEKLPVVDRKGNLKGLITVKDIMKGIEHPLACKDSQGRLRVGAAIGVSREEMERAERLNQAGIDCLVVDTAHGHSRMVLNMVKDLKAKFPDLPLIAGNVATGEGVEDLIKAGADGVKVGVGPGSICTTRVVTGAGVPQFTAIKDCSRVAQRDRVPIIADGGVRHSGDITKALAAGASSVMIGNLLAGTEESPGEKILYEGRSFKLYRGMGSLEAMKIGARDRYFQEEGEKLVPEGVEGRVPYKGSASDLLFQLVGGVKAGMAMCGAATIGEFWERAQYVQVTGAGLKESHPHNVAITKEPPNYSIH